MRDKTIGAKINICESPKIVYSRSLFSMKYTRCTVQLGYMYSTFTGHVYVQVIIFIKH